jgi:6-phosphofructokinase 1
MGRNAGWITAASALFQKAMPCEHLIYLPEHPVVKKDLLAQIETAWKKKKGVLVSVSEGIKDENGADYGNTGIKDGFGHVIPGGAAQSITDLIINELKIKSRAEKPGLLGRVSMPYISNVDRDEAYQAGAFAVKSAVDGKTGFMVAIEAERKPRYASKMVLVPLEKVANVEQKFPDKWLKGPGQNFTDDFITYCQPLVDLTAPEYGYLG